MNVRKTKAAIIDGVLVPEKEVEVLRALVAMGRRATVPELARSSGDAFSHATAYSLLGRLAEQRGLVSREEVTAEVEGMTFKRVFWSPNPAAQRYFVDVERSISHDADESQTTAVAPQLATAGS